MGLATWIVFFHVANGRCFLCMGSGELPDTKKKNLGYSYEFIKPYMNNTFFPELSELPNIEKVKCLSFEGHPTAEMWLMIEGDFFYIGKPVCRASQWYKIPKDEFPEFAHHWNRNKRLPAI